MGHGCIIRVVIGTCSSPTRKLAPCRYDVSGLLRVKGGKLVQALVQGFGRRFPSPARGPRPACRRAVAPAAHQAPRSRRAAGGGRIGGRAHPRSRSECQMVTGIRGVAMGQHESLKTTPTRTIRSAIDILGQRSRTCALLRDASRSRCSARRPGRAALRALRWPGRHADGAG
jgi:hypothetical protein